MAITVEIVQQKEDFFHLKEDWDRLMVDNPIKSTFLTFDWLFTWWGCFNDNKKLQILIARESQEIVGIAPLMIVPERRKGLIFKVLCCLGSSDVDVAGFIYNPERKNVLKAFCATIINSIQWDIFEFGEFPNSAIDPCDFLNNFPQSTYISRIMDRPHIFIPTTGNWNEFYKSLPKHLRRVLKRKERMVQEEGKTLEFQRFQLDKVIPDHLQTVFEINSKAHFPDMYATEEIKDFHLKLADTENNRGKIDISFLYLDQTPIAFEYGFFFNNVYEAWRGAFNTSFQDYSPGSLLFQYLLMDNFKKGISGIDLLRGDHEYKRRWGGNNRPYTLLWIVPRKKITACMMYVWLPLFKQKILKYFEKRSTQSDLE